MSDKEYIARRSTILYAITALMMIIFVARLFFIQVIEHDKFVAEANAEQLKQFEISANRGEIYAMDGNNHSKLVMNERVYTVWADPKTVDEPDEVIKIVNEAAGGNARTDLKRLLEKKETRYQILATRVTHKQAQMIKDKKLAGIGFDKSTQRVYPEGALAAQTLGFVDAEGNGKYGIEGALNRQFAGQKGLLQTVTDVRDVPLTIGNNNIKKPAVDGDNIVLTIDKNIQAQVEKTLATKTKEIGAEYGSVIVMNPQNGKIMAMSNVPTYNPAEYNKVEDIAAFNNSVISSPYEPGSVIKTLTTAAGLDRGLITADSTFYNSDYIKIGDKTISNATKGFTGNITMQTALNMSLNTGMVNILQRMGNGTINSQARNMLYDYFYNKYKLGQLTNIELSGEAPGTIVSPDKQEGNAVRYSNMTFGQGLDLTMLQVAAAFSVLVNGGDYYTPSIINGTIAKTGEFKPSDAKPSHKNVISKQASNSIKQMTHTARGIFKPSPDKAGYYVGGKTGTSETLINGKYSMGQTVATYLGYGGADLNDSRYVIMVQVSGPGKNFEGAKHAMPIFNEISNWMLDYLKLSPKS